MKNIFTFVIVILLSVYTSFTGFAMSFNDIDEEAHSWAIQAIDSMNEIGFIKGYSDGSFKPDNSVTKLEALSLTARVLGSLDNSNESLVKKSVELYSEAVSEYKLSFGVEDICYLLFKGIFTTDELNEYLSGEKASSAIKRYEMAVLLTKAVGAEKEVSKNIITTLEFNDTDEIPAYAKKYVEFTVKSELMLGAGDNMFLPQNDITRAQAAVLMNKLYSATKYTYVSCTVSQMDDAKVAVTNTVTGDSCEYPLDSSVAVRYNGKNDVYNNNEHKYAVITMKDNKILSLDFISDVASQDVKSIKTGNVCGIYLSDVPEIAINTSAGIMRYTIAEDCEIILNGYIDATLYDIKLDSAIKLSIENDIVKKISPIISEDVVQFSGKILHIEKDYSVLTMQCSSTNTNVSITEFVFITDNTLILDSTTGEKLGVDLLQSGNEIIVLGSRNNGLFRAQSITLTVE